jgi:hypothetical protein
MVDRQEMRDVQRWAMASLLRKVTITCVTVTENKDNVMAHRYRY